MLAILLPDDFHSNIRSVGIPTSVRREPITDPTGERKRACASRSNRHQLRFFVLAGPRKSPMRYKEMVDGLDYLPRLPRKNLLLGAFIEAGALKAPVRVRNLSESGAMLEGTVLPDPGVGITLQRSDIRMGATVIWRTGGRCGVKFDDASISVEEWVTGNRAPSFNGVQGQARVDAIQRAVRSGAALPAQAASGSRDPSAAEMGKRIVDELRHVRLLLDTLGEEVAEDPEFLQRHNRSLQNLDRASQILENLATVMDAADPLGVAKGVPMQDLRARLLGEKA
jgi:hypothetical protein